MSLGTLADTDFLANETAFELAGLPESLLVLGGRYVALECAQMLARLGSRVTVLQRSSRIPPRESPRLTEELTAQLRAEGLEIVTDVSLQGVVVREPSGVTVEATIHGRRERFHANELLVATGRTPNTAGLGLETSGVKTDEHGFIAVNEHLETTANGIYAAGDVVGERMFVYTAAYEGVALLGTSRKRDYTALPWVVFTDPQVAGVGMDEAAAKAAGIEAEAVTLPLSEVPRALAARDTRGFIQLIRKQQNDRLVGVRILAPEGSELLMLAALAIRHGISVSTLASTLHPYLTLGEGIKLAALSFGKDVRKLSCCAV